MDRKNRVWHRVLTGILITVYLTQGCTDNPADAFSRHDITIELSTKCLQVRSILPEEDKVTDVNILIFDSNGVLEKQIYSTGGDTSYQVSLLKGEEYTFTALANFGVKADVKNMDELDEVFFHLVYPDEYKEGLPMYVVPTKLRITSESHIMLDLVRLMSKISIRIDRSHLSEDVSMTVTSVRIGNCPKRMSVFKANRSSSGDDNFNLGFELNETECAVLNDRFNNGISDAVDVFMLENMHGTFSQDGISSDQEKVFSDTDPRSRTCSYIEMDLDYLSPTWISSQGPLKYRFYLGDGRNNLDIERNCHYTITVCPKDEGINGDGWRVDKSRLQYVGAALMEQYPSDYIRGDIGQKIHIGCRLTPYDTPFDIGLDYLEFDKERGIYDYEIDSDGHGVTLTLTGSGTGLIYMEAGPPINDTALFLVEVNL